jgi:hypothetical protein
LHFIEDTGDYTVSVTHPGNLLRQFEKPTGNRIFCGLGFGFALPCLNLCRGELVCTIEFGFYCVPVCVLVLGANVEDSVLIDPK